MKTCVIGVGVIGNVHIKALKQLNYDIVGVCDIDVNKAQNAIVKYDLKADAYADYKQMILSLKPDVVHICTPHYLHAEMIIFALNNDVNTLCEKPLCIKTEDIPKIIDAESKSKAILGVCHQNRYNGENLFVKDYLKDKEVITAHGQTVWNRNEAYYNQASWRGKWDTEGGGVLINQALHTLDLMQWFMGEPNSVTATISNLHLKDVIEVEDTAFITMDNGKKYTFFATTASGTDFPVSIDFCLQDGKILSVANGKVFLDGDLLFNANTDTFLGKACYGTGHVALIADFYKHVSTGAKFDVDGKEASKVIKIILSAYLSKTSL